MFFLPLERNNLTNEFHNKLNNYQKGLSGRLCGLSPYNINGFLSYISLDNDIEKLLKNNLISEEEILRLNQVKSIEELKGLKQVILCTPPKKE